jgi:phospholipid transport system transporter-binding protein
MAPAVAGDFALDGEGGRFRLAGCFGFETAARVLERGDALFRAHPAVELDLSGVTDADSAGLAVLLAWIERARRRGHQLRYVGIPPQLAGIARITDVEPLLHVAERPQGSGGVSAG